MTKEFYASKRTELVNAAQALIDAGKLDEFEAAKSEIENLDAKYEAEAKAAADLAAISKSPAVANLGNMQKDATGTVVATTQTKEEKLSAASPAYLDAWAKKMQGLKLSDEEDTAIQMVNAVEYTHTTENTGVVIPTTVVAGILSIAEGMYPIYRDVSKTNVKGILKIIKGDLSEDAKWYDEKTKTDDAKETFAEITLSGCELSRRVKISWMLRSMATQEFIPYITRKMGEKVGKALGYGASHGKGKPANNEFKPEPMGIITALEKEESTPQVIAYTAGALSYKNLTEVRAKIRSQYTPKLYANNATVWGELANVMDTNKRPLFIADPAAGGVGRILGMIVEKDDSLADGEILLGDMYAGYHLNTNESMSIRTFENDDERNTRYVGYAVVDGTCLDNKAFSLLKRTPTEQS